MKDIITDEMRSRIGARRARSKPWVVEFEPGAIRRFAEAIDDPNPLYHDPDFARTSPCGSEVAPPMFLGWPLGPVSSVRIQSPLVRNVTGGLDPRRG